MSALGEAMGGEHVLLDGEKKHKVSLITDEVMLAYERHLFAKAREAAQELKPLMEPSEFKSHLKSLNDDYLAGEYAFGSVMGQKHLKTTQGMLKLSCLLFKLDQKEMIDLFLRRKDEITSLIQLVIHESFPTAKGNPEDPKA